MRLLRPFLIQVILSIFVLTIHASNFNVASKLDNNHLFIGSSVFGYSQSASIVASFSFQTGIFSTRNLQNGLVHADTDLQNKQDDTHENKDGDQSEMYSIYLSLCNVSNLFVRGFNYRRRRLRGSEQLEHHCHAPLQCQRNDRVIHSSDEIRLDKTKYNVIPIWERKSNTANEYPDSKPIMINIKISDFNITAPNMYMLSVHYCSTNKTNSRSFNGTINGSFTVTNPNHLFPKLGYEERYFPVFAITIFVLQLFILAILSFSIIKCLFYYRQSVPSSVKIILFATSAKALSSVLTFNYFYSISQSGLSLLWNIYVRLFIGSTADFLFIYAVSSTASAMYNFPSHWFVDQRSHVMFAYIFLVIQMMIYFVVKTMYPIGAAGAVFYVIFITGLVVVVTLQSVRNIRFLNRYSSSILNANIDVKTTPILRYKRFQRNFMILCAVCYVSKIILLILFDYIVLRPDAFWGGLESCDTFVLLFISLFSIPTKNSPLYLDLSNTINPRVNLHRPNGNSINNSIIIGNEQAGSSNRSIISVPLTSNNNNSSGPVPNNLASASISATGIPSIDATGTQETTMSAASSNAEIATATSIRFEGGDGEGQHGNSNNNENRTQQQQNVPRLITWTSGMPLPMPDARTWGLQSDEDDEYVPTVLPTTIVLGSPGSTQDSVTLAVGWPLNGPLARHADRVENGASTFENDSSSNRFSRLHRLSFNFKNAINRKNQSENQNSNGSILDYNHDERRTNNNDDDSNGVSMGDLVRNSSVSSTAATVDGTIIRDS